jgi:hypothetical protein
MRHVFIKRGDSLLNTCIRLLNKQDFLAAAILGRSLLEHSVWSLRHAGKIDNTLKMISRDLREHVQDRFIDASEIQEIILLGIWGTRLRDRVQTDKELKQYPITKILAEVAALESEGYLEPLYDYLCEASHPNNIGNHQFIEYQEPEGDGDDPVEVSITSNQEGDECQELIDRTLGAISWSALARINMNTHIQNALATKLLVFDKGSNKVH